MHLDNRRSQNTSANLMYPSGQHTRSGLLEWAVAVLGASAAVFLACQVHLNSLDQDRLQAGYEEARRVTVNLSASVKQAEEAFQKREIHLQKVESQEARHAAFLNGLLELSKTDPDARGLVVRHKVGGNVSVPDAGPVSRAPVASPTPQRTTEQPPAKTKSTGR